MACSTARPQPLDAGEGAVESLSPLAIVKSGIDVSWAQAGIDWDKVKATGLVDFVYSRASNGIYSANDDPNFRENHNRCKALAIPFGAFHFFHFDQDPSAQATHFLSRINGYTGELCPMVDVEEQSGTSADNIGQLAIFAAKVDAAVGCRSIIYTNADTWNSRLNGTNAFAAHKLWVADWTYNPNREPVIPRGFADWTVFQWTNTGSINGIHGNVDRDVAKDVESLLLSRK
jgi:lysozyme